MARYEIKLRSYEIGERSDGLFKQVTIADNGRFIYIEDGEVDIRLNRNEVSDMLKVLNREFLLDALGAL